MSSLKNVIKKNKKANPSHKPSKFYKPPTEQKTDIALPDDIKIELSQDFEAHRASGSASERINDFDRMHPVHGMNKGFKHACTWFWVPIFGYIETPVRLAWHLALGIVFTVLSLITICQVHPIRRLAWNHIRMVRWYLGGLLCCYLPIPCCDSEGWPWHYLEYYFASGCFAACCYLDLLIRFWELCFPMSSTEVDYPSECESCVGIITSCCKCCGVCCKCLKKLVPK